MSTKKRLSEPERQLVIAKAASGHDERSIAHALGLTLAAFRKILARDPRSVEALERGKAALHDTLVDCLYRAAKKGNVVSAIFLLKTRYHYVDQPKAPPAESRVQVAVVLPRALDEARYEQLIHSAPPRALKAAGLDMGDDDGDADA